MKAQLEQLEIDISQDSYKFFKSEVDAFTPYWHYHPEIELTFISKGEGTRFVGDSISTFNNFDLVLVGSNIPHHWVSHRTFNLEKQIAYVFQFKAEIFETFKECVHLKKFLINSNRGIQFIEPSETLIQLIKNFEKQDAIVRLGNLMVILDHLYKHKNKRYLSSEEYVSTYTDKPVNQKFGEINNYILKNLDQKRTINHMADLSHMVPQSFCRWFKKHSGHSFINFLNQVRIQRASQQLLASNSAIQHIALNCGFETLSHFNRTFKQIEKCSPRDYRKQKKLSKN